MLGEKTNITVMTKKGIRYTFNNVIVKKNISALQDKQALENNSYISIRVFDKRAGEISTGDKVVLRTHKVNPFPYEDSFTVTSVRFNYAENLSSGHIRLICT